MLGVNVPRLWTPTQDGENEKVGTNAWTCGDSNKCLFSPLGGSLGNLFIGVVRGSVIISEWPPNCPVYTECIITRVLQTFLAPKNFILSLSGCDTCLGMWVFDQWPSALDGPSVPVGPPVWWLTKASGQLAKSFVAAAAWGFRRKHHSRCPVENSEERRSIYVSIHVNLKMRDGATWIFRAGPSACIPNKKKQTLTHLHRSKKTTTTEPKNSTTSSKQVRSNQHKRKKSTI
jgi:hypothetical protein